MPASATRTATRQTAPAVGARVRPLRVLGRGPLADIVVAAREGDAPPGLVVLKVMRERTAKAAATARQGVRGTGALAALRHRHVIAAERALWVGDMLAFESPYVRGLDLEMIASMMRARGQRIPAGAALEVIRAVAASLDAAWRRVPWGAEAPLALAHRDLKPTNVMLDRDGAIRVLDFAIGFTSLAGRDARTGALQQGLVRYLSPDRRDGRRGDGAGDVYALGVLGLELLRGSALRRPTAANPGHDRLMSEVVADLSPMADAADRDAALRHLLLRMVGHDPEGRPSAAEIVARLRQLVDGSGAAALEDMAARTVVPNLPELPVSTDAEVRGLEVRPLVHLDDDDTTRRNPRPRAPERTDERWDETDRGWARVDEDPPTVRTITLEPEDALGDGLTADLVPTSAVDDDAVPTFPQLDDGWGDSTSPGLTAELDEDALDEPTATGLTSELHELDPWSDGAGDGLTAELREIGDQRDGLSAGDGLTSELSLDAMPPDPASLEALAPASPARRARTGTSAGWWVALMAVVLLGAVAAGLGAVALAWVALSAR